MTYRPIDRDNPQEREAALRMLKLLADPRLTLDDILAYGGIDDADDHLSISVRGVPIRCKVER